MHTLKILMALALTACAGGESSDSTAIASVDSMVAAIDREVASLRHDTVTVYGLSAEGTLIDAAFSDTTLRRLEVTYLGETGQASESYYFNSQLFFVIRREYRYDAPLSGVVIDSTITRFDLTAPAVSGMRTDSLRERVAVLRLQLQNR